MWEDGFSIDDGPLRSFDNPDNVRLLEAVMSGQGHPDLMDPLNPTRMVSWGESGKREREEDQDVPFLSFVFGLGALASLL